MYFYYGMSLKNFQKLKQLRLVDHAQVLPTMKNQIMICTFIVQAYQMKMLENKFLKIVANIWKLEILFGNWKMIVR